MAPSPQKFDASMKNEAPLPASSGPLLESLGWRRRVVSLISSSQLASTRTRGASFINRLSSKSRRQFRRRRLSSRLQTVPSGDNPEFLSFLEELAGVYAAEAFAHEENCSITQWNKGQFEKLFIGSLLYKKSQIGDEVFRRNRLDSIAEAVVAEMKRPKLVEKISFSWKLSSASGRLREKDERDLSISFESMGLPSSEVKRGKSNSSFSI